MSEDKASVDAKAVAGTVLRFFGDGANRTITLSMVDATALAQAALRSQVAEGWISVKDRMPVDGTYLCLGHGSTPFICHMRQGEWWRQSFAKRIVGIAHWMPIAAAPGDAEGGEG